LPLCLYSTRPNRKRPGVSIRESEKRRPTESIGFRLDKRDLDQLRELAALRKESLNTLVSQMIDRYLKIWIYDHSYGFFSVSNEVLKVALAKLSDGDIEAIADGQAAKVHREIIRYIYGEITRESVESYLDVFGQRFETYKHFRRGSKHTITIYHGISLPFSKLYYEILRAILGVANIKALGTEGDVSETGFSIVFNL
jgi:hypothetical protein